MAVVIETTIGDFTVDLYADQRPRTCTNFLKLCKMHYFNFNLVYSVERNFVAQMGDPTGTGRGGESVYQFMYGDQARLYEGEKRPVLLHRKLGTISMAAYGNNMYGSQFFITLGENLDSLDDEHLVFGEITEGLEIIAKLNDVLTDDKNRPYQDIRITHTIILDDPFPDPEGLVFSDESPLLTQDVLVSDYIAVDECIEDTANKDIAEIREEIEAKEAEARATILEMVGDIPDAEMAPPENVLFVCKLNPVTTSEDLQIIFSRFGKVNCAEVIKDHVTGNSLQYAFIEFDSKRSCEDAYFKMDNVLIDDRRIHVDFSQSVSKIKWRGRGRGVDLFDDKGNKLFDKRNPSRNFETTKPHISNDGKPKSRFIDPEAYKKRYEERQNLMKNPSRHYGYRDDARLQHEPSRNYRNENDSFDRRENYRNYDRHDKRYEEKRLDHRKQRDNGCFSKSLKNEETHKHVNSLKDRDDYRKPSNNSQKSPERKRKSSLKYNSSSESDSDYSETDSERRKKMLVLLRAELEGGKQSASKQDRDASSSVVETSKKHKHRKSKKKSKSKKRHKDRNSDFSSSDSEVDDVCPKKRITNKHGDNKELERVALHKHKKRK